MVWKNPKGYHEDARPVKGAEDQAPRTQGTVRGTKMPEPLKKKPKSKKKD